MILIARFTAKLLALPLIITVTENPIIEAHMIHFLEKVSDAAPAKRLDKIRGTITAGPVSIP